MIRLESVKCTTVGNINWPGGEGSHCINSAVVLHGDIGCTSSRVWLSPLVIKANEFGLSTPRWLSATHPHNRQQ